MLKSTIKSLAAFLFIALPLFASPAAHASDDGTVGEILISATALGSTFYMHDSEGRIQFLKAFATNLAVTYALKNTVHERRPNGGGNDSFPSGHASAAFQGAAFIHARYGFRYGAAAYLGASYVGWRRVATDHHYTKDVVAGAAIGIASSFIFTRPYKGFEVTPLADNGFYGVTVSRRW